MADKQKSKDAGKPEAGKPAKPQPYKGPPSNKADHAAFKRADKTVIKRMRVKF